jgi:predicted secreted hydrolase
MRSAFAAKNLVFAHAAVTDLEGRVLLHDQRIARAGFGVAQASENRHRCALRDWSLVREDGSYGAHSGRRVRARPALHADAAGAAARQRRPLAQGARRSAGQLLLQRAAAQDAGQAHAQGRGLRGRGTAWLDHEWSEALMHPEAVGWDWIGMNLDDGSALTAFHLRRKDGSALWGGGSFRTRDGVAACLQERRGALRERQRRGAARARGRCTRRSGACRRRPATSKCAPCSTTRSWTAAARPAACTGKGERSARCAGAARGRVATWR